MLSVNVFWKGVLVEMEDRASTRKRASDTPHTGTAQVSRLPRVDVEDTRHVDLQGEKFVADQRPSSELARDRRLHKLQTQIKQECQNGAAA